MRTFRTLVVVVAAAALLGAACGDDKEKSADATTTTAAAAPSGPQTYTAVVDAPSTLGAENLVYGAFFPKTLSVRPGDTVVFENRSSNDIHTVTLGVKSDRTNQPVGVMKNGQANPSVFGPCVSANPPMASWTTCGGTPASGAQTSGGQAAGAPAPPTDPWTGKGYWNSGVVMFAGAPAEAGSKTATVKLAADIVPGPYTVTCLLHAFMESTLQVVADDSQRQTPAEAATTADREIGAAKVQATGIPLPTQAPAVRGATVSAGWGDKLVAVNRYSPETVSIKVGETVTWKTESPYMPHTVSFQPPFKSPTEPNAFLPTGAKSGSSYAGGVSHSGGIGPPPEFPTDTFSLKFTKAGTYPYLCLLHPGMAGTVQVS